MIEVVSNVYMYPILIVDQRADAPKKMSIMHPISRKIIDTAHEPIILRPI